MPVKISTAKTMKETAETYQQIVGKKRGRRPSDYVPEGQENEEPTEKKPAANAGADENDVKIQHDENLKSEELGPLKVARQSLQLSVPPPASPFASVNFKWTPEDNEIYALNILQRKMDEEHSYVLYDHVYDNIQTAVTPTGHDCMFNFLAEIQLEQRLSFSTLLHSMHLFDYILSKITIHRYDFLLIGCTCLFLVSKLEEIYPPTIESLLTHSNYVFSKAELFSMERTILQCLDFKIARPTRVDFLQYLEKIYSLTKRQNCLAHYLLGLSFFDFDLNYHRMSVTAAAALIVTFQITSVSVDTVSMAANLCELLGCSDLALQECIVRIRFLHHVAHTGHGHKSGSLSTPSAQHSHNSSGQQQPSPPKGLSQQLTDIFSSDECHNVSEITALPLQGLNLKLLRNYSIRPPQPPSLQQGRPPSRQHSLGAAFNNSNNHSGVPPLPLRRNVSSSLSLQQQHVDLNSAAGVAQQLGIGY